MSKLLFTISRTFLRKFNFLRKKNFEIISELLAQKFQPPVNLYWQHCQNGFLRVQGIIFRNNVLKKPFAHKFWELSKKTFKLCREVFDRVVKTPMYVSSGIFTENIILWRKIFLPNTFDMDRKNFGFCRKKIRQVCPNRILGVHRNSSIVNLS